MRPMFYGYPDDERSWQVDDQYLFGPDLLVAPVVHPGARQREVFLPGGGSWTELSSGRTFDGGQVVTVRGAARRDPRLRARRQPPGARRHDHQLSVSAPLHFRPITAVRNSGHARWTRRGWRRVGEACPVLRPAWGLSGEGVTGDDGSGSVRSGTATRPGLWASMGEDGAYVAGCNRACAQGDRKGTRDREGDTCLFWSSALPTSAVRRSLRVSSGRRSRCRSSAPGRARGSPIPPAPWPIPGSGTGRCRWRGRTCGRRPWCSGPPASTGPPRWRSCRRRRRDRSRCCRQRGSLRGSRRKAWWHRPGWARQTASPGGSKSSTPPAATRPASTPRTTTSRDPHLSSARHELVLPRLTAAVQALGTILAPTPSLA